jgi:hypothetical protein
MGGLNVIKDLIKFTRLNHLIIYRVQYNLY